MDRIRFWRVHWLAADLEAICGADNQLDGYSSDPAEASCGQCCVEAWWQLAKARSRRPG